MELTMLTTIAIDAARAAGKVIQESMGKEVLAKAKEGGSSYASQIVTEVDLECDKVIGDHLLPTCEQYGIGMLTEESADDGSRFECDYFWCVDPLDGTLAFVNQMPGFSVSIALVANDGTPQIGVVFDPSTNTLYQATRGLGTLKNGQPWDIASKNDYLTYVTDSTLVSNPRAAEIRVLLQKQMEGILTEVEELAGGGAVLNAVRVLENGPACMLKFPKPKLGGGSLWDFAATACIYNELGLPATDFNGHRLDLNKRKDTFMNEKGVRFTNF